MTLLSTVKNAMALCSLTPASTVFASQEDMTAQFKRLLMVEGRDLLKRHDWNILQTVETLTCAVTEAQTGYPVAAFDRMSRGVDMWNTSNDRPIVGPMTAEEWNEIIVRNVTSVTQYWRIIGGILNIVTPSLGDGIRYEYISKNWIKQAGTTPATVLSADTDTFVFDEHLLELGLVWRFKQAKGLDYAEDMRTHDIYLADQIASDRGGRRVISTTPTDYSRNARTWHGTITPV